MRFRSAGHSSPYAKRKISNRVSARSVFKPEFLNRISEIIFFKPLDKTDLTKIVDLEVTNFGKRLAERKITREFTQEATGACRVTASKCNEMKHRPSASIISPGQAPPRCLPRQSRERRRALRSSLPPASEAQLSGAVSLWRSLSEREEPVETKRRLMNTRYLTSVLIEAARFARKPMRHSLEFRTALDTLIGDLRQRLRFPITPPRSIFFSTS